MKKTIFLLALHSLILAGTACGSLLFFGLVLAQETDVSTLNANTSPNANHQLSKKNSSQTRKDKSAVRSKSNLPFIPKIKTACQIMTRFDAEKIAGQRAPLFKEENRMAETSCIYSPDQNKVYVAAMSQTYSSEENAKKVNQLEMEINSLAIEIEVKTSRVISRIEGIGDTAWIETGYDEKAVKYIKIGVQSGKTSFAIFASGRKCSLANLKRVAAGIAKQLKKLNN